MSEKIKSKLLDTRKEVPEQKQVRQIYSVNGDMVYYLKDYIIKGKSITQIYKKSGSKKELKVDFPVQEKSANNQVINNEFYFLSKNKVGYELDVLNVINSKTKKLCNLGKWSPSDGWLGGIRYINNELYIVLHRGYLTMTEEELFKIKNGQLVKLTSTSWFINYDTHKDDLYYLDYSTQFNMADNLYKLNMVSKKKSNIGNKGFCYGLLRKINHGGSTISVLGNIFIKDGYLFTLGYKENDQKAKGCVYKINLLTNTQIQVTPPATSFWVVDNIIYYLDFTTGNLANVDLQGNNQKILIGKRKKTLNFTMVIFITLRITETILIFLQAGYINSTLKQGRKSN